MSDLDIFPALLCRPLDNIEALKRQSAVSPGRQALQSQTLKRKVTIGSGKANSIRAGTVAFVIR